MKLVTDINFFPDETIVKLEDDQEIVISTVDAFGKKMDLDTFRELLFQVDQGAIYVKDES